MNIRMDEFVTNLNQAVEDVERLRRNVLISKTTGTVAASVGTTLNIIGIILIRFTLGISIPILCGTGTALAVTGGLTSLGTTIAEVPIQSNQKKNIDKLIEDCASSIDTYRQKSKQLEEALGKCDSSESRYFGEFLKRKFQSDVAKWLNKAGHLHKDTVVDPTDLKNGDHILRTILLSPCNQHHGIFINDKVVEFCQSGVNSRPLKDFMEGQKIKRRGYLGIDLPVAETEKLVYGALSQLASKDNYGLLTYNCEDFATSMKLLLVWSGQVDDGLKITSDVFKNIHRPISVIIESVESGTQVVAALVPKSIFSIFSGLSTPVMSSLAKTALVLGPVSVALDITSLVFDYKKENLSAECCKDAINQLKEIKSDMQAYGEEVRKRKAQLTERLEDERIEKRWREDVGIKIVKLEPDFMNQVKLDPNFMNQVKLEPDFINQVKLEPELQHPPPQQQQDHHLQQHNHQQQQQHQIQLQQQQDHQQPSLQLPQLQPQTQQQPQVPPHLQQSPQQQQQLDDKPYKCQTCHKGFHQMSGLKIHSNVHNSDRPFKCTMCEKTFTQLSNLKNHMNVHNGGDKPYKCDLCGKGFNQVSSMRSHRNSHTGEKRHKCTICEKTYTQSGSLKVHMNIHSGFKPYKCVICEKEFHDPSNFRKHKAKTHSNHFTPPAAQ